MNQLIRPTCNECGKKKNAYMYVNPRNDKKYVCPDCYNKIVDQMKLDQEERGLFIEKPEPNSNQFTDNPVINYISSLKIPFSERMDLIDLVGIKIKQIP